MRWIIELENNLCYYFLSAKLFVVPGSRNSTVSVSGSRFYWLMGNSWVVTVLLYFAAFWRLCFCLSIVYELALIFVLFQVSRWYTHAYMLTLTHSLTHSLPLCAVDSGEEPAHPKPTHAQSLTHPHTHSSSFCSWCNAECGRNLQNAAALLLKWCWCDVLKSFITAWLCSSGCGCSNDW